MTTFAPEWFETPFGRDDFKKWSQCKKQFFYRRIQGLKWPSDDSNFKLGRTVHKLMEFQAQHLPVEHLLSSLTPLELQAYDSLKHCDAAQWTVLASEWGFQVPIKVLDKTLWLTGRVDRISQDPDGNIVLIDWKTGTSIPRNPEQDWQTRLYLYAVHECAQDLGLSAFAAEQLRFLYIQTHQANHLVQKTIHYSMEKHQHIRAQIKGMMEAMLQETTFNLPQACPDRYCSFKTICGIQKNGEDTAALSI
jgi:hypothetical protein